MRNDRTQDRRVRSMTRLLRRFASDESGVTALEYCLIAILVAVAIIAGATTIGTALDTSLTEVSTNF